MVIVPPHLVVQWVDEIRRFTKVLKTHIYFGDPRDNKLRENYSLIDKLTRNHPVFQGPNPQQNVIISSYFTMSMRHGPSRQRQWQRDNNRETESLEQSDTRWPSSMTGKFGCLVLDEAHQIRNVDTLQWRTMHWMRAPMNVLLTATPTFNSIEDIRGLMPFLLHPDNERFWDGVVVPAGYDPFINGDPEHPCHRLMFTIRGLDRWIWKNDNMVDAAIGLRLKPVIQKCVVRRQVTSLLPLRVGNPIGDSIPPAFRFQRNVRFTPRELVEYETWANQYLKQLVVKTRTGRIVWKSDMLRLLQMLTTWIPSVQIEKVLRANQGSKLYKMIDDNAHLGRYLAHLAMKEAQKFLERRIVEAEAREGDTDDLEEGIHVVPSKWTGVSREQALCYLLAGSPKMRAMIQIIRQEVLLLDEKSLVWCSNPAQQWYIGAVLNLAGIPCDVYHADLTHSQRQEMRTSFNENPNEIKVLICSYYVNSAGSNLQQSCRNAHLFDIPNNDNLLKQAIGRIRRLGQTRAVKVYTYVLEESFNMRQIAHNLSKAVPALGLFLNSEAWDISLNTDTGDIDMGSWVLNRDKSISRVSDIYIPYLNPRFFIKPDRLFKKIITSHSSTTALIRNRPSLSDLEAAIHGEIGGLDEVRSGTMTDNDLATLIVRKLLTAQQFAEIQEDDDEYSEDGNDSEDQDSDDDDVPAFQVNQLTFIPAPGR